MRHCIGVGAAGSRRDPCYRVRSKYTNSQSAADPDSVALNLTLDGCDDVPLSDGRGTRADVSHVVVLDHFFGEPEVRDARAV